MMACNIPTSINAATASIHFHSVLASNMHKIARVEPTSCEKSLWDKTPPSQHFYYTVPRQLFWGMKLLFWKEVSKKIASVALQCLDTNILRAIPCTINLGIGSQFSKALCQNLNSNNN